MKQRSPREKTESQFLMITGTLVVLIGGPAFYSLMKEPVAETAKIVRAESRTPASYAGKETEKAATSSADKSAAVVHINCDQKVALDEVQAAYVRLTGLPCKQVEDLKITNRTNGFTASVIFKKDNLFTTDFIDLKEGENDLEVVSYLGDGSKTTKKFKVNRRMPAQNK
jgi:hypothetical protein